MLAMIDNYDSFTYNLVQYFGELGQEVAVFRNDQITPGALAALKPDYLVISPGPCSPDKAGISVAAIRLMAGRIPILGVCLGHQSIGQAFGGKIIHAKQLMHGKTSMVSHDGIAMFNGLSSPFVATRYHSLVIDENTLPDCLDVTARADDGEIMAVKHRSLAIQGLQFHPESIETTCGHQLLQNFLDQR